jgi:hypothetical protein
MTTAEQRQQQRDQVRKARTALKASQRRGRWKRAAPQIGPGMIRRPVAEPLSPGQEVDPSLAREGLPRCSFPGCVWRWPPGSGPDRPCTLFGHAGDGGVTEAAAALGIELTGLIETAPNSRDNGADTSRSK